MKHYVFALASALFVAAVPAYAADVDIDAFVKPDELTYLTISPNGDYLAMTVPRDDQTGLVVMRRKDLSVSAAVTLGRNVHVLPDFRWVSPGRILFRMAERFGSLEQPIPTGELVAIDAEGGKMDMLVGYRVAGGDSSSRIVAKQAEPVYAELVDDLPNDDRHAIISVSPFDSKAPLSRAEELDVVSGRRTIVARAPVRQAVFTTDHAGVVRFARGHGADNASKLYYRDGAGAEWKLVNDENQTMRIELPLGFSADGKLAYFESENASGPDSIVAYDPATGSRKEVLRDAQVDPWRILYAFNDPSTPVGVAYMNGAPSTKFFDRASPEAKLQAALEEAFPNQSVEVTSTTKDGKEALISVSSASSPGDYYLLNTQDFTAKHVFGRRQVLAGKPFAPVRTVALKSRDGLDLHGFLTLPAGAEPKNLPMVVMPHGGPIGIFDQWQFNDDAQLLAAAGYAVLQVNFRGSGNYGRAFTQAGSREWGGKMQEDVSDATRWAIAQGIADGGRVCIYGASYGGYAALMGAATEPQLYRCAVGYAGVYDLPQLLGEFGHSNSGATYGREWLGDDKAMLASKSPTQLAAKIKVPVLLVAGGEDRTAPISHSKKMEKALRDAGGSVETLYEPDEGHGFYLPENRRKFYAALLAFLAKNDGAR